MHKLRIAVIGAGPGGYVAAVRAAQLGAQVTLFEREHVGGVCLNSGCIPTKALLHSAHLLDQVQRAAAFGVYAKDVTFDFDAIQRRKSALVQRLTRGIDALLRANSIHVVRAAAAFLDGHTLGANVEGEQRRYAFDGAIVACGARPALPPIPGATLPGILDSRAALTLDSVPSSLVAIGGGVIGVELAQVFSAFHCQVTILEMQDRLLPSLEAQAVAPVAAALEAGGVGATTCAQVTSIEKTDGGYRVNYVDDQGEARAVQGEKVLISAGRRADVEGLALPLAGVRVEGGAIQVDEYLRTSNPDVYAVGDCTGQTMLAHGASSQGEIAAGNAMGGRAICSLANCPTAVYTHPQIAQVGLTKRQALAQGIPCREGIYPMAASGKALIAGEGEGYIKAVVGEPYGQLLGMQIVGPLAADLIGIGCLALEMEALADDFAGAIFPHPTFCEGVREAVMAAQGRAIHGNNG